MKNWWDVLPVAAQMRHPREWMPDENPMLCPFSHAPALKNTSMSALVFRTYLDV